MIVDGESGSVLPVNKEVWNIVVVVVTWSWCTEHDNSHITKHVPVYAHTNISRSAGVE